MNSFGTLTNFEAFFTCENVSIHISSTQLHSAPNQPASQHHCHVCHPASQPASHHMLFGISIHVKLSTRLLTQVVVGCLLAAWLAGCTGLNGGSSDQTCTVRIVWTTRVMKRRFAFPSQIKLISSIICVLHDNNFCDGLYYGV